MSDPAPYAAQVRLSESSIGFLLVGLILVLSGLLDLMDPASVIGPVGSLTVAALGVLLTVVGLWGLWSSRGAWAYPVSAARGA